MPVSQTNGASVAGEAAFEDVTEPEPVSLWRPGTLVHSDRLHVVAFHFGA
jgi:hypothetical protein